MKKQSLLRELKSQIINFFHSYGLKDDLFSIPKHLKNMGTKIGLISLVCTIMSLAFSFLLRATNLAIEGRFILLGIILFMLYQGERVLRDAVWIFQDSEDKRFDEMFSNEIMLRGATIITSVSQKVLKYDFNNKLYQTLDNESIINTIKNYLSSLWKLEIWHKFDILQFVSICIMLIAAIVTNRVIPQFIYIPLIVCFVLISFLSSAYIDLHREVFFSKQKKYDNEESVVFNDLLRVPLIVEKDLDMRVSKLKDTVKNNNNNILKFSKKLNTSRLIISSLELFSQYGIIIFYLLQVNWNTINLGTIAEITATLAILKTALSYTSRLSYTLNDHNEKTQALKKEEEDMKLILDVYYQECNKKSSKQKVVENIHIKPFSMKYLEESENDKPFTLVSEKEININQGEIAILLGPSGSGKSTFMKLITERIRVEKSVEIPSTSRFLYYDEKLRFGSLSIFEELFAGTNPDLSKMQDILENLHLWAEISSNCFNVWQWMKEKKFNNSLSNGQKQRLILAKMLYFLNSDIDVLVLDECTSGLDDISETDSADADRILEYIIRYSNKDKNRIVILATHQNINKLKSRLGKEYCIKNFLFVQKEDFNTIYQI